MQPLGARGFYRSLGGDSIDLNHESIDHRDNFVFYICHLILFFRILAFIQLSKTPPKRAAAFTHSPAICLCGEDMQRGNGGAKCWTEFSHIIREKFGRGLAINCRSRIGLKKSGGEGDHCTRSSTTCNNSEYVSTQIYISNHSMRPLGIFLPFTGTRKS